MPAPVLTPRAVDGTRLNFPIADIEVLKGDLFKGPIDVTIRVDGRTYEVKAAMCGLRCRCDAVATEILP